eukprot:753023-Hanusia_phi.AAC.10
MTYGLRPNQNGDRRTGAAARNGARPGGGKSVRPSTIKLGESQGPGRARPVSNLASPPHVFHSKSAAGRKRS